MFGNLFKTNKAPETRSEVELEAILTGKQFDVGSITRANALNIPAVASSIDFITSTIASLPIRLYKQNGDAIEEIEDDYRLKLLNEDTGDLLDSNQFKRALVTDMLLYGAGYAYVERKKNLITGLYYVDCADVQVIEDVDKVKKSVTIWLQGKKYEQYEVLRLTRNSRNGVTGVGVLAQNPLLFNTMHNALKFENTAISTGVKRGFLKATRRLEDKMLEQLKQAWKKLYSTDVNNSPDVIVLNEGITFEPASGTATENQLNESKRTNSDLVYNLFGLSSTLFNCANGTNANEVYLNAIKTAVIPVVTAFNTALNKFILLEKEKEQMFFAIDVSEVLKSTVEERYRAYELGVRNGWLQVDEIRKLENMKPLGLEFVKLGLGDVLYYPARKEVYTTNTNATHVIGSGEGKEGKGIEN